MDRSFGGLWAATTRFVASHGHLLLPVAAAFLFLPQLLFQFGMRDMPADATSIPEDMRWRFALLLAVVASLSILGQLTITQLALGRGERHDLRSLLGYSAAMFLPALAASLMQSIAVAIGLFLLILPGLYLAARLILVVPALVDGARDPLEALRASWRLTQGNGLRILAMLGALVAAFLVIIVLMSGIGSAIGVVSAVAGDQPATGWGLGRWLFELANSAVSAAAALYYMVFVTMLYRAFSR